MKSASLHLGLACFARRTAPLLPALISLAACVTPSRGQGLSEPSRESLYDLANPDLDTALSLAWASPSSNTPVRFFDSGSQLMDLTIATDPTDSSPTSSPKNSITSTSAHDREKRSFSRFRWVPAVGESLLYTGIMHSFDLATQAGTRDSLNGKWFKQYIRSVSELRG